MEETAKLGPCLRHADRTRAGRVHDDPHAARRRRARGRGRHVHRLLVAVHRPRARARRSAALLRRERGVDVDRPPPLGAGGRGRPHRPADRTGDRDAAVAARRAEPSTSRSSTPTSPATSATTRSSCRACARTACCSSTTCCGRAGSLDPEANDDDTVAIRAFNDHVAADDRVDVVMLPDRRRPHARPSADSATIRHFGVGAVGHLTLALPTTRILQRSDQTTDHREVTRRGW